MADEEQRVERLDEPDVEAHRLDKIEGRHDPGLDELAETEDPEPNVEAHRLDRFVARAEKPD